MCTNAEATDWAIKYHRSGTPRTPEQSQIIIERFLAIGTHMIVDGKLVENADPDDGVQIDFNWTVITMIDVLDGAPEDSRANVWEMINYPERFGHYVDNYLQHTIGGGYDK